MDDTTDTRGTDDGTIVRLDTLAAMLGDPDTLGYALVLLAARLN